MIRYILMRIFGLFGVLLIVSALTFVLMHRVPGGPFDARALEKQQMIPENIKRQLNEKYGLDKPVWQQYALFVKNAFFLDFGYSMSYPGRTVVGIFAEQWSYSLQLGGLTFVFASVAGIGLGILAAIKPNSFFDYFGTGVSVFCLIMPSFVFAILLQFVFSAWLGWLPTGGWNSPKHWILPVLANSLSPILILQRFTRTSLREALKANYVRTARAKGLSRRRIILIHVFKNALTPLLTVGGPLAAGLIVGSFFVESIFRIPGIGFYFVSSIGVLSQLSIAFVGIPLGAFAGLRGGWFDYLLMRVIDVLSSLPTTLFYILLMVALGAGFGNLILAMTLTGWIGIARLARGQILSLKQTDYIRASKMMGAGDFYIFRKHVLRNILPSLITSFVLGIPAAMFAEAGLSFLGLGVPSPQISWGQMIGMYQPFIRTAWHLTVFPAVVLAITMLAWFLVADSARSIFEKKNEISGD